MIKSQQYSLLLQKLFNPEDLSLRIDINALKEISNSDDYHSLIDLTAILTRLFLAGKQKLSLRQLIGKSIHSEGNEKEQKIQFFLDGLSANELIQLIKELFQIRKKLKHTIYSSRLHSMIGLLSRVLEQVKPQLDKKEEELGIFQLGDFELLEEQYKKAQNGSQLQMGAAQSNSKITDLLKNPRAYLEGKFSNLLTLQKFMGKQIFPLLQRSVLTIPLSSHTERQSQLSRILKFIGQFYISHYKIEVEISKNTLVETRMYTNKLYKQLLSRNYIELLKSMAKIVNQSILCPSSINIQLLLLRIIRRIYMLTDQTSTHSSENIDYFKPNELLLTNSPASMVKNPLYLVLRNISLFSEGREDEMKEAAMLCYKIVNDKNDLQLASMIENSDDLRFLRNSKFYTSKAYIYSEQIQKVYEPSELCSLYLKLHQSISARQIWAFTVLIQKPSSLFCWQFYVGGYDIRFGIFKVQQLRQFTLQQYEQGKGCKEIVKLERVQNNASNPHKGHVFLKVGVYKLLFDNSFSLMRSKDLFYSFIQLQYSS